MALFQSLNFLVVPFYPGLRLGLPKCDPFGVFFPNSYFPRAAMGLNWTVNIYYDTLCPFPSNREFYRPGA